MIRIKKESIFTCVVALSFVLTTITGLRIPGIPVGPGELMMLFSSGVMFLKKRQTTPEQIHLQHVVINFWIVFFASLLLGTMMNLLTMRGGLSFHTFVAYLLCLCISYSLARCYDKEMLQDLIKKMLILGSILFFALCVYAKYKNGYILGIQLLFGNRFTGGAKNPNQLALFVSPAPFLAIYFASVASKKKITNAVIGWLLIAVMSFYVGICTKSDAIIGAWAIGLVYFFYRIISHRLSGLARITVLCFVCLIAFLPLYEIIMNVVFKWFNELDEGGSRAVLWIAGLSSAKDSLLIGYGPGSFALGYAESHNTFIDLLTQGGLIALIDFCCLLFLAFRNSKQDSALSTSFVAMCAYILGHFAGRQPVLYLYIIFLSSNTVAHTAFNTIEKKEFS